MNYPMPGPIPPGRDYPGYQPGPQRRAPWLWVALAIAVVIIVVLSAVVLTQMKNDDSDKSDHRGADGIIHHSAVTTRPYSAEPSGRQPNDDLRGIYRIGRRGFSTWLAGDN